MSKGPLVNTPLALLIEQLEREGFSIGIGLRVKMQKVLYAFAHREPEKGFDLEHLREYLRPLVAKSEKQQELFDHAFNLYLQHIQKETKEYRARILEGNLPDSDKVENDQPVDVKDGDPTKGPPKKYLLKRFLPAFVFFGIIFLLYLIQISRPAPDIQILTPMKAWVELGSNLMIEGSINGFLVEDKLQIDGKTVHGDRYFNADNRSFKYEQVFDSLKTYNFTFTGKNTLSVRDSVLSYNIVACEDKPSIDFNYKFDSYSPERVSFYPVTVRDTTQPYRIRMLSNGKILEPQEFISITDSVLIYEFANKNTQLIEMRIEYLGSTADSICRISSVQKAINNKLAPKGNIKELLLATLRDSTVQLDKNIKEYDKTSGAAFDLIEPATWSALEEEEPYLLVGFILLIVVLIPLGLEVFYFRKRKTKLSKQVKKGLEFDGVNGPFELEFPKQNQKIKPEKDLFDLSRMLKTRQEAGSSKLDIRDTIRQTAKSGGFIDLQFKETTRLPEYLVIVDRKQSGGFHLELFGYLNDFLQNEDTLMQVFYFNNDMRYLSNEEHPHGISLETVSEKFPDHVLLVISDGKNMVNPKTDQVFDWAKRLVPKWEKKFLLSPRNYSEWDSNEDLLETYIPVLPASLDGMRLLSEEVFSENFPDARKRAAELKLKTQPSFYSKDKLQAITDYLKSPALFQWFCSLAIYPEVHWPLVLAIGDALLKHYSTEQQPLALNYQNLHKISEVSHLLEGQLDDDLRLELLRNLDPKAERIARKTVLKLLNKVELDEDSYAYRELLVQKALNRSLVYQNSDTATQDLFYLWKNNLIEDQVSKNYIESPKNLWQETADVHFSQVDPKSWRQLLFPRGPIYLVLAATLLLILNSSFFPRVFNKTTAPKTVKINYSAQLNNYAVKDYEDNLYSEAYDSLKKADSLASVVPQVPYNIDVMWYNSGITNYNQNSYERAILDLENVIGSDSLDLDALHFLGLSHYFNDSDDMAVEILDRILSQYPDYLEKYSPNIQTVLAGVFEEICEIYADYTSEEWRKEFLKEPAEYTWSVALNVFDSGNTSDKIKANAARDQYRSTYENIEFDVLTMGIPGNEDYPQHLVVMAKGLVDKAVANDIKSFAESCNIGFNNVTLVEGYIPDTSTASMIDSDTSLDDVSVDLCGKYSGYTSEEWRGRFIQRYVSLNYNVVVGSFIGVEEAASEDASNLQNQLNAAHPNLYFDMVPARGSIDRGNREYFVLLARGLPDAEEAREIANFAKECGIAKDAYVKKGIDAEKDTTDNLTQKICDKYSGYNRSRWRNEFIKTPIPGSFHVVVNYLETVFENEAIAVRDRYNSSYPNQRFEILKMNQQNTRGYSKYAIVIAQGLTDESIANEILSYVSDCEGISKNAYIVTQPSTSQVEQVAPCRAALQVYVRDAGSAMPLNNTLVTIFDANGNALKEGVSNKEGLVKFTDLNCDSYTLVGTLADYRNNNVNINLSDDQTSYLDLEPIDNTIGMLLDLPTIYFDYDGVNIRPDAEIELAKILALMRQYPELQVRIEAHTDSRAKDKYNLKISERRARSVLDWLVTRGIDRKRLTAEGYGETQLLNECSNGVQCSEEQHQLNNRVNFIIVDN